jgi:hypothetical protein
MNSNNYNKITNIDLLNKIGGGNFTTNNTNTPDYYIKRVEDKLKNLTNLEILNVNTLQIIINELRYLKIDFNMVLVILNEIKNKGFNYNFISEKKILKETLDHLQSKLTFGISTLPDVNRRTRTNIERDINQIFSELNGIYNRIIQSLQR